MRTITVHRVMLNLPENAYHRVYNVLT